MADAAFGTPASHLSLANGPRLAIALPLFPALSCTCSDARRAADTPKRLICSRRVAKKDGLDCRSIKKLQ